MRHLLIFWLLLMGGAALGQNSVQITVTALPPFDPFLQDYFYQPGKLQVLVRNTTTSPLTIKLQASLSGDNGVEIATLPGYQPLQPLVLQPLQARYLTVADVKNMVDLSQVSVQGFDRSTLLQGKALPEGEYQLCLQAIDLQTNRPLSPAETGCTRIPVRSVEPPILIAPLCDQEIKPQIPQNIVFTWAPPAGVLPSKVEYTLRIVELPLLEADPNVFIDAVVLPATGVEVKNLRINTFLYSVVQPALKPGRKYAWRVQARDPMGKLLFLNDGKSPVCSFQYGEIVVKSQKLDKPIVTLSKTNGLNGKLIQAVCPNGQLVTTNTISQPNAGTALVTLPQDRTIIEVQTDGSGKVVIQKAGTEIVVSDTENALAKTQTQTVNSGDVLTVGNEADLVLSWMADPKLLLALSQYSGKKDSASVRSIVQNIPNAHYEISIFGAKGTGVFGFAIPAETPFWVGSSTNEFHSFDPDQAGFPLQFGQRYWYRVRLVLPQIALLMLKEKSNFTDESGLTSDMCTFVLKQKPPNYEDYVVSGLLRYQFSGFPGNFPAPNTTVSIRFKKPDGAFGRGPAQLDYLGKTDVNGVFRVRIPRKSQIGEVLTKADNKNAVSLNYTIGLPDSKYYQVPAEAKDFFLKTSDPDSTDIGPLLANAYAYRLKVVVKKRFDKLFIEALTGIDEKTGTVKAGTQTIDAGGLTKVDNSLTEALVGIKIHLYRKTKPAYLPPVEGQLGLTQLDPLANGCVPISQGVTGLEVKADGSRQAVVVFDRLLPTVNPGDEYYIQAETNPKYSIVAGTAALFANVDPVNTNPSANALNVNGLNPNLGGSVDKKNPLTDFNIKDATLVGKKTSVTKSDPDQAGNNVNVSGLPDYFTAKETFVAPEDTVSLSYAPFVNPNALLRAGESKTYRFASKDYGVLTSRPPSSRIRGRLVYTWPNRSEKFVMANMPFVIRVGYSGDGKTVLDGLGTHIEDPEPCQTTEGIKKYIEGVPTTTTGDGKQTIAFSTEDDGHVVAVGTTDANGYFNIEVVNLNQKGEVLVNATVKEEKIFKGVPCIDPNKVPVAGKKSGLQTAKEKYLDPIWNPGPDDNFQAKGLAEFVVTEHVTVGMNNNTPFFLATNGQVNVSRTALPGVNQALPGQKGKGGPAATDEPPADLVADLSISRVFFVDVQSPFYNDPGKAVVVNAFQATDAGEFTATVRQWTDVPSVVFNGQSGTGVKGARVVVYRQRGLDKYDHLPELEGDGLKKYQPLPANAKNGAAVPPGGPQASTEAVDYFGEGFTDEKGSLVWTTKPGPLLLNPKYYRFYALPNSAQDVVANQNSKGNVEGGYFAPKIQKADPDFRVDIANSRLIVRLLDPGKQSGLVDQENFSQGLAGMVTLVVSGLKGGTNYTTLYTKDDGYLEIDMSAYWTNSGTDTQKKLKFAINTYVYGYNGPGKVEFDGIYAGQQVVKNIQFTPGTTITGRIMGGTVKAGKTTYTPQPSFLIRADSSVSETGTDGRFMLAVPTTNDQQLVIRPRDPAYWDDTLTLDLVGKKSPLPLDDRVLQRRQHRMRFLVLDQATGKPLKDVIVALPDIGDVGKAAFTGQDGVALFDFENVSISNYRVQLLGSKNTTSLGLVNQTFEVVNSESKAYITYTVKAEMGATITGTVTLDGKPVKDARVYLNYNMIDAPSDSTDSGAIETYSVDGGSFTLRGVPIDNATVSIRATLGNPGALYQGKNVIGVVKLVSIKNKTGGPVSLSLTSYDKMVVTSALGFPLTVEALKPNPDGTVTVTGQLDLRKSQTGFKWLEGAEVVRIRDVKFKPVANGGAKPKAVPVDKTLILEGLMNLKFRYANRYNVDAQSVPTLQPVTLPLRILADNDGRGQLMGRVQIVDNSFQYPSTYMNFEEGSQFFLSNLTAPGSNTVLVNGVVVTKPTEEPATSTAPALKPDFASLKADNKLLVLSALSNDLTFNAFIANPAPTVTTYGICGPNGQGIDFKLLNFDTTADPTRSFFDADGKIHLSVWLDCKIPNAQPARFDVNIDNLVLDNQSIYPKAGSKPLQIGFEAWTLQVKNWTLDPKQGGITATDLNYNNKSITMQTNQVDIPFGEFVLRPDIFRLNYPRLSNLDVGGVASLSVIDPTSAIFTYDQAFSGEGRWKLSIPGVGGKPAAALKISTAQGNSTMLGDKPINFDYVQVLSNNQTIMSLTEKQTFFVKGNSLAGFAPTQFASGAGYLDLAGQFRVVDAPRVPSVPMTINLTKSSPARFSPLPNDFGFEIKGHAAFKIRPGDNNLLIDKDRIIIPGAVEEAGATPKLNAEFRASAAHKSYPYFLQVLNQNDVQAGNMKLDVVATTSAQANKTDWQKPLVFVGQLYQTGTGAQLKQAADGNVLQFSVYGDMHVNQLDKNGLQADSVFSKGGNLSLKPDGSFSLDKMPLFGSGKDANGMLSLSNRGVGVDALKTPFGEVKLFFDFKAPRLVGSIRIAKIQAYDAGVQGGGSEPDTNPGTPESPQPIDLGPFKVMGQGSMLLDPDGMYFVASLMAIGDVIPPPIQGVNLGVGIGYRKYEPDAVTMLLGASTDPLLICKIGDRVNGLFIGAGVTLFHKEKSVPFVVGKAWFKADANLTASAKIDIGSPGIMFSAGANASAEAGIQLLCASASVGLGVFGDMTGKITYPLALCAAATIGVRARLEIDACGLFGTYTLDKYFALVGQVKKHSGQKVQFDFDIDSFDGPLDAGKCDFICPCANFTASK